MPWWLLLVVFAASAYYLLRLGGRRKHGAPAGTGSGAKYRLPYNRTESIHTPPLPGGVMVHDLRTAAQQTAAKALLPSVRTPSGVESPVNSTRIGPDSEAILGSMGASIAVPALRVVCWNIERGFKLQHVIDQLAALDPQPDVILLQEVDIDCKRSGNIDVTAEIARALDMQYVFVCDMLRVNTENENDPRAPKSHNPKDFKENYGVEGQPCEGAEGNAVLTRFDILQSRALVMPCVRNRAMPYHAHRKKHTAAVVRIRTPIGPVTFYSAHFDAFSGRAARTRQWQVLAADAALQNNPCVIGGDFNTHNHGVARLVPRMALGDPYRWKAWGMTEAEWWRQNVFGKAWRDPFDHKLDCTTTITKKGIKLWAGKIDYILYPSSLGCIRMAVSDCNASDHQFLLTDLVRNAPIEFDSSLHSKL